MLQLAIAAVLAHRAGGADAAAAAGAVTDPSAGNLADPFAAAVR